MTAFIPVQYSSMQERMRVCSNAEMTLGCPQAPFDNCILANIDHGATIICGVTDTKFVQGLARILQSKSHLSRTQPGGTYNWQAPETILGYKSSFPADIFSYGVVLLEIITGWRPVRGQYRNPR